MRVIVTDRFDHRLIKYPSVTIYVRVIDAFVMVSDIQSLVAACAMNGERVEGCFCGRIPERIRRLLETIAPGLWRDECKPYIDDRESSEVYVVDGDRILKLMVLRGNWLP